MGQVFNVNDLLDDPAEHRGRAHPGAAQGRTAGQGPQLRRLQAAARR